MERKPGRSHEKLLVASTVETRARLAVIGDYSVAKPSVFAAGNAAEGSMVVSERLVVLARLNKVKHDLKVVGEMLTHLGLALSPLGACEREALGDRRLL